VYLYVADPDVGQMVAESTENTGLVAFDVDLDNVWLGAIVVATAGLDLVVAIGADRVKSPTRSC